MNKVLITPRSLSKGGHPALSALTKAGYDLVMPCPGATPSSQDLINALPECVGWLAGVEPVSEAVIDAAPNLKVISRNGTGVDNLPLSKLESQGITLCRAAGTNARGVAELALTLAMTGLRRVVPTHEGMKTGDWPRSIGHEIQGATIGIIGLGAIGANFARFCLALGANVRGFDPFAPADVVEHQGFKRVSFEQAISGADVVSLHAPMPKDGKALVGATELAAMNKGAVLVNTARAGLVDSSAMLVALNSGQIGTYATDVFETEPPEPSALLSHPNVILTSHIGGFTKQSVDRSTQRAVDNLLQALNAHAG